jgi:hypothetical protein
MVLEHPAYLPDLNLYDFFLFPTTKNHLKGSHFETTEEIQMVMMTILNILQMNDFWKCLDSWKKCWNSCIAAGGTNVRKTTAK